MNLYNLVDEIIKSISNSSDYNDIFRYSDNIIDKAKKMNNLKKEENNENFESFIDLLKKTQLKLNKKENNQEFREKRITEDFGEFNNKKLIDIDVLKDIKNNINLHGGTRENLKELNEQINIQKESLNEKKRNIQKYNMILMNIIYSKNKTLNPILDIDKYDNCDNNEKEKIYIGYELIQKIKSNLEKKKEKINEEINYIEQQIENYDHYTEEHLINLISENDNTIHDINIEIKRKEQTIKNIQNEINEIDEMNKEKLDKIVDNIIKINNLLNSNIVFFEGRQDKYYLKDIFNVDLNNINKMELFIKLYDYFKELKKSINKLIKNQRLNRVKEEVIRKKPDIIIERPIGLFLDRINAFKIQNKKKELGELLTRFNTLYESIKKLGDKLELYKLSDDEKRKLINDYGVDIDNYSEDRKNNLYREISKLNDEINEFLKHKQELEKMKEEINIILIIRNSDSSSNIDNMNKIIKDIDESINRFNEILNKYEENIRDEYKEKIIEQQIRDFEYQKQQILNDEINKITDGTTTETQISRLRVNIMKEIDDFRNNINETFDIDKYISDNKDDYETYYDKRMRELINEQEINYFENRTKKYISKLRETNKLLNDIKTFIDDDNMDIDDLMNEQNRENMFLLSGGIIENIDNISQDVEIINEYGNIISDIDYLKRDIYILNRNYKIVINFIIDKILFNMYCNYFLTSENKNISVCINKEKAQDYINKILRIRNNEIYIKYRLILTRGLNFMNQIIEFIENNSINDFSFYIGNSKYYLELQSLIYLLEIILK